MSGVAASSPSERRCKAMALPPLRDEDARAIDTFLDASWAEAGLSRQTLSSYRRDLAGVARWRDGAGGGLAGLDRAALFDYLARRTRDGYSARSNARLLSALRAFFGHAVRRGLRRDDPTALLDPPRLSRPLPKALPERQVEALLAAPDVGSAEGLRDRAIFVDARGKVVDGDAVMLLCAKQMKREGRLADNTLVATVMSNIGLEMALRDADIGIVRTAVGDKYVMEEMTRRGLSLGGEQSGHVIFSDHLFTGDGLATALNVLRTMASTGRELGDLASELTTFPQVLLNVRVSERVDLATVPEVVSVMSAVESKLAGQGRLLVRYSGTEPLLRVMLEGRDEGDIRRWGQEIIDAVTEHVGSR